MKKNKVALLLAGLMLTASFTAGCGKKKEEAPTTTEEPTVINVEQVSTMSDSQSIEVRKKEGYILSDLTGEWIDESLANQRPLCIMINNIIDAILKSNICSLTV